MATTTTADRRRDARDRAIEEMPKRLRTTCREIGRLWARATARNVKDRYKIALLVKRVRDRDGSRSYGSGAVQRLAAALGRKERTLYEYATVADTFSEAKLKQILARRDLYGRPLSWTHLTALARVVEAGRRHELLEQALAEGLSARELARRLEERPAETDPDETGPPRTVRSALGQLRVQGQTVVQNAALWDEALFRRIEGADPGTFDEDLREALAAAQEEQQEAGRVCRRQATRLKKCLEMVEEALEGQPAPA